MRIVLTETSQIIPLSDLIDATLRSDLFPVPMNIEFSVNRVDFYEPLLANNKDILVGEYNTPFTIVRSIPIRMQAVKGDSLIGAVSCIAVLKPFVKMMQPLESAKILENTSLCSVVRSIGVSCPFGTDIPLKQFVAFCGTTPSFRLAKYMKQEACVLCYENEKVNFVKVKDFFKRDATLKLSSSNVAWFQSEQKSKLEKLTYVSVDPDGQTQINQNPTKGLKVVQRGNLDSRQSKNMEQVLVSRGTLTRNLDMRIMAGQTILIDDTKYVVLTAAHYFNSGNLGSASATTTQLWIANL